MASTPWLGANFWSRTGGPHMWTRYDPAVVRQELAVLAEHGCNVTRSFCFWPDFVPAPEQLDEDVMNRFADLLEPHVEDPRVAVARQHARDTLTGSHGNRT